MAMEHCSSSLLTAEEVADMMVDLDTEFSDDEAYDMDETFAPGSDVEFGDLSDQEEDDTRGR